MDVILPMPLITAVYVSLGEPMISSVPSSQRSTPVRAKGVLETSIEQAGELKVPIGCFSRPAVRVLLLCAVTYSGAVVVCVRVD